MPAGKPVPKVLKVTGNILGSQLEVSGDVGLVKAAAFRDSTLWAGYTAAGGFAAPAAIKTFRVTGRDGAFANS